MLLEDFITESIKEAKAAAAATGAVITKMTLCAKAFPASSNIIVPSSGEIYTQHTGHDWSTLSTMTLEIDLMKNG